MADETLRATNAYCPRKAINTGNYSGMPFWLEFVIVLTGIGYFSCRNSDAPELRRQLKQPIPAITPADSRHSDEKEFFSKNLNRPE